MDSVFKTQEFKRLQRKWYKKLENEGFRDIEYQNGRMLAGLPSKFKEGADDYFTFMTFFSQYREHFKTDKEQFIIALHAEGRRIVEICKQIEKKWGRYPSTREVHSVIVRYRTELQRIAANGKLQSLKEGARCMIKGIEFGTAVTVGGMTYNSIQANDPQSLFTIDFKVHMMPDGEKVSYFIITPRHKEKEPVNVFITNVKSWKGTLPVPELDERKDSLPETLSAKKGGKAVSPVRLNVADVAP